MSEPLLPLAEAARRATAARALPLLDLTDLSDDCTEAAIADLCARAVTPFGSVAAVCIWPRFVPLAKERLAGTGVRVATVINFPAGGTDTPAVLAEGRAAIRDGADEIDLVMPYRALMAGQPEVAEAQIRLVREVCAAPVRLKVILETGRIAAPELIRKAADLALRAGADFIKTSTGKVPVNATPEAATIMLEAIRAAGGRAGFKAAGGIRTTADAGHYLGLADGILGPSWATPETFRFGASGLLADLLAHLTGTAADPALPKPAY
jgi:deoxyribose-phosphate aldolase